MNTSAATMPMKTAAVSSMRSMKASMRLRLAGEAPFRSLILPQGAAMAQQKSRVRNGGGRRSIGRLELGQGVPQLLHNRIGIATGLLDVVGPRLLQRLGCLAPLGQLLGRERIHFVRRIAL